MLLMLRAAVRSTIGKRPSAGTVCFTRLSLDFDRFLVAIMNPVGAKPHLRLDPQLAFMSRLIFDLAPQSHNPRLKALITTVNRKWPLGDGFESLYAYLGTFQAASGPNLDNKSDVALA